MVVVVGVVPLVSPPVSSGTMAAWRRSVFLAIVALPWHFVALVTLAVCDWAVLAGCAVGSCWGVWVLSWAECCYCLGG